MQRLDQSHFYEELEQILAGIRRYTVEKQMRKAGTPFTERLMEHGKVIL